MREEKRKRRPREKLAPKRQNQNLKKCQKVATFFSIYRKGHDGPFFHLA
jgi:hypothetical protein